MEFRIKVVDSKDTSKILMQYLEPIKASMLVQDFKKKLCSDCDTLSN